MNIILFQKAISFVAPYFGKIVNFLKYKIQIPLFVLLIPVVFATVYYFKFKKEKGKLQEIANRTVSTNRDLREKISTDSLQIIKLNNEKQQIINYHFLYLDTLAHLPRAKLQAELSRYYER
jgi:Tfp pilus assembly protein PilO